MAKIFFARMWFFYIKFYVINKINKICFDVFLILINFLANTVNSTKLNDIKTNGELLLNDLDQFPELPNKNFTFNGNAQLLNNGTTSVIKIITNKIIKCFIKFVLK